MRRYVFQILSGVLLGIVLAGCDISAGESSGNGGTSACEWFEDVYTGVIVPFQRGSFDSEEIVRAGELGSIGEELAAELSLPSDVESEVEAVASGLIEVREIRETGEPVQDGDIDLGWLGGGPDEDGDELEGVAYLEQYCRTEVDDSFDEERRRAPDVDVEEGRTEMP